MKRPHTVEFISGPLTDFDGSQFVNAAHQNLPMAAMPPRLGTDPPLALAFFCWFKKHGIELNSEMSDTEFQNALDEMSQRLSVGAQRTPLHSASKALPNFANELERRNLLNDLLDEIAAAEGLDRVRDYNKLFNLCVSRNPALFAAMRRPVPNR